MGALFLASFLLFLGWVRVFTRVRALAARAHGREIRADSPYAPPAPPPLVSILVPARDEEAGLDACLRSLRAQDYPAIEIVVVDDRSTDRTAEIIAAHAREDPRVVAVAGEEPPPGWAGKASALRQAAAQARGEWLLTTDADTVHAPASVRVGLGFALAEGLDALSTMPRQVYTSFLAHLLTPQIFAFFAMVLFRAERRARSAGAKGEPIGASGGWTLLRRSTWDHVGGMESARGAVAEDLALAQAIDRAGHPFRYVAAPTLWSTAAYTTWRQLRDGYARNPQFYLGGSLARALLVFTSAAITALLPFTAALIAGLSLSGAITVDLPAVILAAAVVQYGIILALQFKLRELLRVRRWMALLAPVAGVLGGVLILQIFLRARRRRPLAWKGRSYAG